MDTPAQDTIQPVTSQLPVEPIISSAPIVALKKSPLSLILLSIVSVAVLALASYFYWQNTQLKSQLTATLTPSPSIAADPTVTWQTFTSEKYTFSFKYPQNLLLRSFGGSQLEPKDADSFIMEGPYENVETQANAPEYSIKVDISNSKPNEVRTTESIISFKKIGSKYVIFQMEDSHVPSQPITNPQIFDQILSTFKFSDTSNTTFSLCKSVNLGLSLSLPSNDWTCKADENFDPQQNGADGTIVLKSPVFTILISSLGRDNYCDLSDPNPESPRYDPTNTCSITGFYSKNNIKLQTFKLNNQTKEIFGQINNDPSVSIKYSGMEERDLTASEKSEIIQLLDSIKSTN